MEMPQFFTDRIMKWQQDSGTGTHPIPALKGFSIMHIAMSIL